MLISVIKWSYIYIATGKEVFEHCLDDADKWIDKCHDVTCKILFISI